MGVAPAGVVEPNSGHHHLLIDAELPPPTKADLASLRADIASDMRTLRADVATDI
jgi:hypothetical protein